MSTTYSRSTPVSVYNRFPNLLPKLEELEELIIDKSAEEVVRSLTESILSSRHDFADKLSEGEMVALITSTYAPILQSWKDN
jgi:hypothetical protein